MGQKNLYILYDERANYDEYEASVLSCADTYAEAIQDAKDFGFNLCIFKYDIEGKNTLANGKLVKNWYA
jgi:hypothetical protein